MRTAIFSIQLRWKSFLAVLMLIVILIFISSGISFFFIRDLYSGTATLPDGTDENGCHNYIHCFFTVFNLGLRNGGGIGEEFGLKSYTDENYWGIFIFNYIFFFMMILLMLNIINGIIVDTFQDLREKQNNREDIKANNCFICNINRDKFNSLSIDFDQHQKVDHQYLNYIFYMVKITKISEHDLNSLEFEVLNEMRNNNISFFPVKASIAINDKEN